MKSETAHSPDGKHMPVNTSVRHIRAARIFTAVEGKEPIEDGFITLHDSKIAGVGPASALPADTKTSDVLHYPTSTILPGIVDAHTHLTLPADRRSYEDMMRDPDEMLALISLRNLRRHLSAGVTTLRDNGGRNRVTFIVRSAIERGYFQGPRLLLSGRPLTPSGGHFHWCNGSADGVESIRTAVRELVAEGADHIKIMASGGGTVGTEAYYAGYTVEELRAVVNTAHDFGRPTTAHCRATKSMVNALDAGLDCIEHGEFLTPPKETTRRRDTGLFISLISQYDPSITERMLQSGTFLSFTMHAGGSEVLLGLRAKQETEGLSPYEQDLRSFFEHYYDIKFSLLANLIRDGMLPQLVVSSDAGPYDAQFGNFHLGLEMVVDAGMSPIQALEASTRVAAEACNIGDTVGTLEPGKEADLLVVDGNPLADVTCISSVVAVYKGGKVVAPCDGLASHDQLPEEKPHWRRPVGSIV